MVSLRIIAGDTSENPHRRLELARIEVSRVMKTPRRVVWEALADLASHAGWMRDARSVEFLGPRTRGVGARMKVETRVGPFRTLDVLEVTGWEEGRSISVTHHGLIKGEGVLSVEETDSGSRVSWVERISFPWWLGGPITAWLARPLLAAILRGNLRRLESLVSSP
jgi:uncharacterized protein YndB with AHSA1/START domain